MGSKRLQPFWTDILHFTLSSVVLACISLPYLLWTVYLALIGRKNVPYTRSQLLFLLKRVFQAPDPDIQNDSTDIIRLKGYPAQEFVARTEDGFFLTLHRIPYGKRSTGGIQNRSTPEIVVDGEAEKGSAV